MINEQINNPVLSSVILEKHDKWIKAKQYLYNELITLAAIDDHELTDCMDENLEYAMEIILRHGTYRENAKALHMYAQYFSLHNLLDI
jgi:hypothetical protein